MPCRKREDNIVQLRKDKRDENLQKKRAVFPASSGGMGASEDSNRAGAAQKASSQASLGMLGCAGTLLFWRCVLCPLDTGTRRSSCNER